MSPANPDDFVRALRAAANELDRPRVARMCTELVERLRARSEPYPARPSKELLRVLRDKRHFDLIVAVADALLQGGLEDRQVRRQYAGALIDTGRLTAAREVLLALERDSLGANDDRELGEARGLLGRLHKQIYMDASDSGRSGAAARRALVESIERYLDEFERTGERWHGINAVALLSRAKRDGVRGAAHDPRALAARILAPIEARRERGDEPLEAWDLATAAEAHLATSAYAEALGWMLDYTDADGADAFQLAGTLRQLEEVWQLDDAKDEHARILQVLRSALLRREGGSVEVRAESVTGARGLEQDEVFEAILGDIRYRSFRWYRNGLDRASCVAKIVDRSHDGRGTGFLLPGKDVHESIRDEWVLVTNAHVISDEAAEQAGSPPALAPREAKAVFQAGDGAECGLGEIVFSSPRSELDCTILSLDGTAPSDVTSYRVASRLPLSGKNQRVYVIGHPRGGDLAFSLHDSRFLGHDAPRVHYRTPTEGGSSGSPVFNDDWDLVALHHVGARELRKPDGDGETYLANEGIAFRSILAAVARKLG